ncbi:MAG: hypothetical protein M1817_003336 [Caeruleum heppii]|nr:MAG: hypothetical protein M1817_003336 [Caeruleum heppii]
MTDRPLLSSSRPSSDNSDDRASAEEDELLTGQRNTRGNGGRYGWTFWREVGLFVWAMLATAAVIIIAVLYQHQSAKQGSATHGGGEDLPKGKRNLIFMVSDGMGPTSLSMTRSFKQVQSGLPPDEVLVLDRHLIGSSRTRSTSSLITDSAAGATAFSCGYKSYNGAISVLPDHTPCGTVLEAAKRAGYMTGLVVTTRITDATPACFAAHANVRSEEDLIAEQEVGNHPLGRVVDLILGGGRCHFLPNTTAGSCRADETDVIEMAKYNGFNYIDNRKDFDSLDHGRAVKLPLLGLLAETDIPYEIDRKDQDNVYPSLDEMARTALQALTLATQDSDKGFFLMIEGSRIDHAGHANDPVAQVHEVLAYDKAFASVLKFLEDGDEDGVVVSTSDHETGGLATARQLHAAYPEYLWYPSVLVNASHSAENLAAALRQHLDDKPNTFPSSESLKSFVHDILVKEGLGIQDASDEELDLIVQNPSLGAYIFADMVSRRAQIGWSSHGHSAVDVNIYGTGPAIKELAGNHENTEIGEFIKNYLDLSLDPVTKELREKGMPPTYMDGERPRISWMGQPWNAEMEYDALDHYHSEPVEGLLPGGTSDQFVRAVAPHPDCGIAGH